MNIEKFKKAKVISECIEKQEYTKEALIEYREQYIKGIRYRIQIGGSYIDPHKVFYINAPIVNDLILKNIIDNTDFYIKEIEKEIVNLKTQLYEL
jgi:hypothetical protein